MNNLKTSKKHLPKIQTVPKELSTINTCPFQWSQSLLGLGSGGSRLQESLLCHVAAICEGRPAAFCLPCQGGYQISARRQTGIQVNQ